MRLISTTQPRNRGLMESWSREQRAGFLECSVALLHHVERFRQYLISNTRLDL